VDGGERTTDDGQRTTDDGRVPQVLGRLGTMAPRCPGASAPNPQSPLSSPRTSARDALLIFIVLVSAYSLTFSGAFRVDDEHILAARAQSLAFWGVLHYPQAYGNDRARHLSTLDAAIGDPVVSIEPGQAVLAAGLYRVAAVLGIGGAQVAFGLNILATAFTGAMVFLIAGVLGFGYRPAMAAALAFGLGTMAWPYAKTFFRDPLAMGMVSVAFLAWALVMRGGQRAIRLGVVLVCLGVLAGILIKSTVAVVVLALALSGGVSLLKERRSPRSAWLGLMAGVVPATAILTALVVLPGSGPLARLSWQNYVSLAVRYAHAFSPATALGALGPFFSPAKSIFLLSPLLVLAPLGALISWHRIWRFSLPVMLTTVLLALAQALHLGSDWAGTMIWGLRFMLLVLPLIAVLIAPAFEKLVTCAPAWFRGALLLLLAGSALVQIAGAMVGWHWPFQDWLDRGLNPYQASAAWGWAYNPIPSQLGRLGDVASWDVAWVRVLSRSPVGLLSPLIALGFGAFALRELLRREERRGAGSTPRRAVAMSIGAVVFVLILNPLILQEDPAAGGGRPEFAAALGWIEAGLQVDDLVVLDSYGTSLWHHMMNRWQAETPWYSLPFEIPGAATVLAAERGEPSDAALALFRQVGGPHRRLLYIDSEDAPDHGLGRERAWLDENLVRADERKFGSHSQTTVTLYVAPRMPAPRVRDDMVESPRRLSR